MDEADVAQPAEHPPCKREVEGSSPSISLRTTWESLDDEYYRVLTVTRHDGRRTMQLACMTCGLEWWTDQDTARHPDVTDPQQILRHAMKGPIGGMADAQP